MRGAVVSRRSRRVERLNATGAKDPIDVVIGRWTSWTEQVERNGFIGNNKLLGAEMLGYTSEDFFSSNHVVYPLVRTRAGRTVRDVFRPPSSPMR